MATTLRELVKAVDDLSKMVCTVGRTGSDLRTTVKLIDDWGFDGKGGRWLLIGNEFGPTHLVHARTDSDAYGAWLDEQPTIPDSELWEAYGFDSQADYDAAFQADPADAAHRDLDEAYQYQSNSTGTGIVCVGHYVWMRGADLDDVQFTLPTDSAFAR